MSDDSKDKSMSQTTSNFHKTSQLEKTEVKYNSLQNFFNPSTDTKPEETPLNLEFGRRKPRVNNNINSDQNENNYSSAFSFSQNDNNNSLLKAKSEINLKKDDDDTSNFYVPVSSGVSRVKKIKFKIFREVECKEEIQWILQMKKIHHSKKKKK